MNPSSTVHLLCELGQLASPLCASVFSGVKWRGVRIEWVMHVKYLAQYLAYSKHPINSSMVEFGAEWEWMGGCGGPERAGGRDGT